MGVPAPRLVAGLLLIFVALRATRAFLSPAERLILALLLATSPLLYAASSFQGLAYPSVFVRYQAATVPFYLFFLAYGAGGLLQVLRRASPRLELASGLADRDGLWRRSIRIPPGSSKKTVSFELTGDRHDPARAGETRVEVAIRER